MSKEQDSASLVFSFSDPCVGAELANCGFAVTILDNLSNASAVSIERWGNSNNALNIMPLAKSLCVDSLSE